MSLSCSYSCFVTELTEGRTLQSHGSPPVSPRGHLQPSKVWTKGPTLPLDSGFTSRPHFILRIFCWLWSLGVRNRFIFPTKLHLLCNPSKSRVQTDQHFLQAALLLPVLATAQEPRHTAGGWPGRQSARRPHSRGTSSSTQAVKGVPGCFASTLHGPLFLQLCVGFF